MKKILALLVLGSQLLHAQSGTVDLRSHGTVEIFLEDNWRLNVSEFGDRMIVNFEAKDDANANAVLTFTFPEQDRFPNKSKLRLQAEVIGRPYEEVSVERKSVARELNMKSGYGYYCSFTDPELIGKPPQKGNYKMISVGLILLAPDVLVELAISGDGYRSAPYQQLLGAIEGMEYKPRRLAAAAVVPPVMQPTGKPGLRPAGEISPTTSFSSMRLAGFLHPCL